MVWSAHDLHISMVSVQQHRNELCEYFRRNIFYVCGACWCRQQFHTRCNRHSVECSGFRSGPIRSECGGSGGLLSFQSQSDSHGRGNDHGNRFVASNAGSIGQLRQLLYRWGPSSDRILVPLRVQPKHDGHPGLHYSLEWHTCIGSSGLGKRQPYLRVLWRNCDGSESATEYSIARNCG